MDRSATRPGEVAVVAVTADTLSVRGLDCVDGTPLLDIKPA